MADLTPYATARPLMGPRQQWMTAEDAERLEAYRVYESLYKNVPDAFKLVQRGTDANPIYIPSARTIVEATNRFLAKGWTYALDPRRGTDGERQALNLVLQSLFRREKVWSKFASQRRYGLIRGDSVWHIIGDLARPAGRRLTISRVDPGAYFPIPHPTDPSRISGCHLAEQIAVGDKTIIKRQTYRKTDTGRISYELSWWEPGSWDDREGSGQELKKAAAPPEPPVAYELDPRITALPVYHVANSQADDAEFGTSELQGLERIATAVNQAISDEELALALEGLGLYVTTSGPPVDDDGNEVDWIIGPGRVLEIDENATWDRVTGVTNVTPVLQHIAYLEGAMRESVGVPDIAVGRVDVQTAESGIALSLKMAPLLAKNEEKEVEILSVMDHMLYDIATAWLPVFEGVDAGDAQPVSVVGDPMPVNRDAVIAEITALLSTDPPLISAEYARQLLAEKLGYEFTETMGTDVVSEAQALAEARNTDPFATRVAVELDADA